MKHHSHSKVPFVDPDWPPGVEYGYFDTVWTKQPYRSFEVMVPVISSIRGTDMDFTKTYAKELEFITLVKELYEPENFNSLVLDDFIALDSGPGVSISLIKKRIRDNRYLFYVIQEAQHSRINDEMLVILTESGIKY